MKFIVLRVQLPRRIALEVQDPKTAARIVRNSGDGVRIGEFEIGGSPGEEHFARLAAELMEHDDMFRIGLLTALSRAAQFGESSVPPSVRTTIRN